MNERMKRQLQFFCFNFLITLNSPLEMGATWQSNRLPTSTPTPTPAQAQRQRLQLHLEVTQTETYALQRQASQCCVVCLFAFVFVCSGLCRHVSGWGWAPRGPKTSGALNLSLGFVAHLENYITAANTHQLFKYLNVLIAQRQFYWTLTT